MAASAWLRAGYFPRFTSCAKGDDDLVGEGSGVGMGAVRLVDADAFDAEGLALRSNQWLKAPV